MILRTDLRPGDVAVVTRLHRIIYSREYGFDSTFESYVADPLQSFARSHSNRERMWIAEQDGQIVGCTAIVVASPRVAQLRWFFVDPVARGVGLGTQLLEEALRFSRVCAYESIILWTVDRLEAATRLYRSAGFEKVQENECERWGLRLTEQKYEKRLSPRRSRTELR